jgi:zinc protease
MPQMLTRFMLVALTLLAAVFAPSAQANPETREVTLRNGMKVIVRPDRRAPVLISQVWYRIGSVDETNGITGISHVLEHMMFKGTRKVPSGEFSRRVAAAGGKENAFTSRDHTVYHQQLAARHLPLVLELEADRMRNLVLDEAEFKKEIQVVMEERRWRVEDQPGSLVYETLVGTALQAHPYRIPVIGYMDDLRNLTIQDVRAWYQRWYAPNNATLVVVGDVEPEAVFKLAEKHFGSLKPSVLPVRKPQTEPAQNGIRRVRVKAIAEEPTLTMAWRAPTLTDPEREWVPYALDVLSGVLHGYPGARLHTRLVREQRIAVDVDAGYDGIGRGPSLFMMGGSPAPGRTVEELEAALRDQVRLIAQEGIRPEELARARTQVIASQVFARDSISHQAGMIGNLESAGLGYRSESLLLQKMREVTPEQVQQVARELLRYDTHTVAILDPQPLPAGAKPKAPPSGVRH